MRRTVVLTSIGAATITGCSTFTPPIAKPIIEDHAQDQINAFAIMPSRRMVIVKSNINKHGSSVPKEALTSKGLLTDNALIVCSEASPDVSDDIAANLAAALSGKGPSPNGVEAAQAGASIAQALATSGQSLFKRSQALQFYRDTAYHLCQAKMNGFLNDEEFRDRMLTAENNAVAVLSAEIPWLYMSQILDPTQKEALKAALANSISVDSSGVITFTDTTGQNKITVQPPSIPASGAKANGGGT